MTGTCPAGTRVPSVVEVSAEFGIAASTAQKVMAYLRDEGKARSEVGLGTFVLWSIPTADDQSVCRPLQP